MAVFSVEKQGMTAVRLGYIASIRAGHENFPNLLFWVRRTRLQQLKAVIRSCNDLVSIREINASSASRIRRQRHRHFGLSVRCETQDVKFEARLISRHKPCTSPKSETDNAAAFLIDGNDWCTVIRSIQCVPTVIPQAERIALLTEDGCSRNN